MDILIVILIVQVLNILAFIWFRRFTIFRILALKQQLGIYKRKRKRPKLKNRDRIFWIFLSKLWKDWASELIIVKPETVIRWRKRKFSEFWRRKSQGKAGRPSIPKEHIAFIKRISSDHPEYGEDRIALELEIKFGIRHSSRTVQKYMVKSRRGPRDSQTWRTFLKNQTKAIWTCDFFTQYTIRFHVYYIFVIMEIESRRVIHFNTTKYPTLDWIKQQLRNACFHEQPRFIIHDNDGKYGQLGRPHRIVRDGKAVSCRSSFDVWLFEVMRIRGIPTPYGAPNAAAHVERLIGTLRRECLDRMIIWNERHLSDTLHEYIGWYNQGRAHQGIHGIPDPEPCLKKPPPKNGKLVAIPILNGLHHDYRLAA